MGKTGPALIVSRKRLAVPYGLTFFGAVALNFGEIQDLKQPFYIDNTGRASYILLLGMAVSVIALVMSRKQCNGVLATFLNALLGTFITISGHLILLQSMARIRPPISGDSYHVGYFIPIALIGGPLLFALISAFTILSTLPWRPDFEG